MQSKVLIVNVGRLDGWMDDRVDGWADAGDNAAIATGYLRG